MLDKVAIVTLCLLMIGIGLFPGLMVPMVADGRREYPVACWEVHNVYFDNVRCPSSLKS
ncbi:MAG: hypothetical protein M0C28_28475 [Candidatus Moduliflexus flocculans]|nr:hypothetical protein [Candidatus Moduliflexus flocculans]